MKNEFEQYWEKNLAYDSTEELVVKLISLGFHTTTIEQMEDTNEIKIEGLSIKQVGTILKFINSGPDNISKEDLQELVDKKFLLKYEHKGTEYIDMIEPATCFFGIDRNFIDILFGEDMYYFYLELHDGKEVYRVRVKRSETAFIRSNEYKKNKNVKQIYCLREKLPQQDQDPRENFQRLQEKHLIGENAVFKDVDIKTFKEKLNCNPEKS